MRCSPSRRYAGERRQVALNWLRARPGVASVLFGVHIEALRDNPAAAFWSLAADEIARPDRASQQPIPYPASQRLYAKDRRPQLFAAFDGAR